ncbi:signal transduction histidine kinase/ligand-binding sensor domain-containing protein [Rhizobium sp. BK313]|uniref:ligand-binding sensor domain-containing protein n=1 Tax=Rhizobium sp. BK313 TaxID=2587081 RepID=UPI0010E1449B|nr:sensor histidine kinase [Rhizobium sp. BK313]MBB3452778.1 signal transduction histidine kinase/ligand-binding sensor domain-containing protein [Rhizobium sp. BK313]
MTRSADECRLLSATLVARLALATTMICLGWLGAIGGPAAASGVKVATIATEIVQVHVESKTDIRFRRISLSQGLSQTRVSQIVQDNQGYLWFGTQHGVNRYDGYGFQVFKHVAEDLDSLSGTFIYALFKDRSGTIWVGSDQFLDAFDSATGKFRHYQVDKSNPTVIHISQDKSNHLWLSTSQGLYQLDPVTGETKRFGSDPANPDGLSSNDIKSTGEDSTGLFWVANGAGLEAFDPLTGQVSIRIPLRQEVREFKFHEDAHGTFWIAFGSGSGFATYDRKLNQLTRYSFSSSTSDGSLSGVYDILETTNGDIWFATMGSGLLRFDRDNFQFDSYQNDPTDPQSLAENRAIAVFEDNEGNIWTGLHASPPNMFPRNPSPFRRLWPFPGHVDKLGESLVNTVFEDSKGDVWLGAGGALNRISADGKRLEVFNPAGANTSTEVLAITEDSSGIIWIGTLGVGLISYDRSTGHFTSYRYAPARTDWLSSDVVTRIYIDPSGTFWLTTWNGLQKFDRESSRFTTFKRDPSASAETYFSIVPDNNGDLWLGTTTGLVKFVIRTSAFTTYKHEPGNPSSLSNNTVNSIYIDNGTIWVGTQNGLNRFKVETGKFEAFYSRDGLAGNVVSCILGDSDRLWMSTNRGISSMNAHDKSFVNFSSVDGLPGDDLTGWNACARGAQDVLYFGGFAGATARKSKVIEHDDFVPSVVFTDLQAGDSTRAFVPSVDPEKPPQPVVLLYDASHINVSFAALSFRSPESTKYRYRLAGLDSNWHPLNADQRSISYATLPTGKFELIVQAATGRGSWSSPGASLQIEVLPPWWRTTWFYTVSAALVLAGLGSTYRYHIRSVAADYNIRLEERINERNRVARELHDTLLQSFQGLIFRMQAVRQMLPTRPKEAADILDSILERSDEAIVEGRNAIQSLREANLTDVDLSQAIRSIGEILSAESRATPRPRYRHHVTGDPMDLSPKIREEAHRIVGEALRNAFKHSGATLIECVIQYSISGLSIRVRDDGAGIGPAIRGGSAGHWGIAGMKERAAKIGGNLIIESGSGQGTTIELVLKSHEKGPLFSR